MRTALATAGVTFLSLLFSGCGEPKYASAKLTLEDVPGVVFRFSAADASRSSPVFMDIEGRELVAEDRAVRTRLIRLWVSKHAPEGATMSHWASAECGLEREGEYPGCDIFAIDVPSTGEKIDYYFYGGNWPFRE